VNITGGPDMGLMEVHDAMSVIQEAAHEDANIIFGAVVDPTLTGKVKITVIATGFEHARGRMIPHTPTPVDLTNYTAHLRAGAGANAIDAAPTQRATTITRRPSIDMPMQQRAIVGGVPLQSSDLEPGEVDLTMELDVPAFLRRQNE
jgi:cell division protein FtsZ